MTRCPVCRSEIPDDAAVCPSCGADLGGALKVGQVIAGRYEIVRVLGRGGMGSVYEARDRVLEEPVALKVLSPELHGREISQRFRAEIRLARRITHRNVCRIHEYGEDGDIVYISMELVNGTTVRRLLLDRGGPLAPAEALDVCLQAAEGLAAIHEAGVVHRDLKASNIMRDERGVVRLMDFGIAKEVFSPDAGMTAAGVIIGTPEYMSPEQARGEKIDARSDIYSFGIVTFEMFTGHLPFHAETPLQTLMMHMTEEPRIPDALGPRLRAFLARCLAKSPGDRFADVTHLLDELRSLGPELPAGAPPVALAAHEGGGTVIRAAPATGVARAVAPKTSPIAVPRNAPATTVLRPAAGPVAPPPPPRPWGPRAAADPIPREEPPPEEEVPPSPKAKGKTKPGKGARRTPHVVDRFVLHEKIADGHSGPFFKAYDPVRGTLVGVKLITSDDPDTQHRLLRGAQIWLGLKHPHLVSVLEVRPRCAGYAGIIESELADGIPLKDLVGRPQLSLEHIVSIGIQLCDALEYVHAKGIVHREVKPSNIVVSLPEAKVILLDSGIARHANPEIDAFTRTGILVGDLAYLPPEMTRGTPDQRVDIYAVAVILLELLTGAHVNLQDNLIEKASLLEGVPVRLRTAIVRALDRHPAARFQSAQELGDILRGIVPPSKQPKRVDRMVVTLHGIRTHAAWQRAFAETASDAGLEARMDRWSFGHFPVVRFLQPWSRMARVKWFRDSYDDEFGALLAATSSLDRPSIVAHSFGTYILGYALLRYSYLRFGKVILCGSILPKGFPWDKIIERGQVQAVRNEFGTEDVWTRLVDRFVPGTGASGRDGFAIGHPRLEQERFTFSHSEYFERYHMESRWIPFLRRRLPLVPPHEGTIEGRVASRTPWGLYALYAVLLAVLAFGGWGGWSWAAGRRSGGQATASITPPAE